MDDTASDDGSLCTATVKLEAAIARRVNVAFHQNSVPAISEICLTNGSEQNLSDITVSVRASPAFLRPTAFRFDEMRPHTTRRIGPAPIKLDPAFLFGLTEAVQGEIELVAATPDREIARLTTPCMVLSPSEWTGIATTPELLAAFVRPNDPSIDLVLRKAAEKLRDAKREPSFDGYKSGRKARAWEIAAAIWAVLCDEQIVYALPPQSFEQDGQKVRTPMAVVDRKIATCLDLALLFASTLEQAGLNPLVGLCEGHAFAGLWLIDEEFATATVDEPQPIRKRMQLEELILIETTLLTGHPPSQFHVATERASRLVAEDAERRFEVVIDVRRARHRQIRPLDIPSEPSSPTTSETTPAQRAEVLEPPPEFAEDAVPMGDGTSVTDRLERWKRSLLDLSLRNRLLNFKPTKSAVRLICTDPTFLADLLAKDARIRLLPTPGVMTGNDPRSPEIHIGATGRDPREDYSSETLQRGDIHTDLDPNELEARLTEIFRSARASLEEGGANSLYVAFGFVSWMPQQKQQRYKAPLLLIPVALERKSVRSGFRLVHYGDDPRINSTLLEMMRQDFGITISELDQELPITAGSIDVRRILRIARQGLKDVKGFEVTEELFLGNFSFVKYLMWKDLVDRSDVLKHNPVVKHLIDTPKASYGDGSALPDESRLDEEVRPEELVLPLLADSSQTAAAVAASRGRDFVLFGPPGTGKSQTIANIIAQLLWQGKRVLFVSAKATALTVVRRRLDEIGLGAFCLEVHSAKAQKRAVLAQLKSAWEEQSDPAETEWAMATSEIKAVRDRLNDVVRALHRRHKNGLTVRGAMGRLIAARRFVPGFSLPFASPEQHDEAALASLRGFCEALRIALEGVGTPSESPFASIKRASWSPSWQKQLIALSQGLRERCGALATAATALGMALRAPADGDPRRIQAIIDLATLALASEAKDAVPLLGPDGRTIVDAFASWRALKKHYDETASRLSGGYRDDIFDIDLRALESEWRDACHANIIARRIKMRRVRAQLSPCADGSAPRDLGTELAVLVDLGDQRAACARLGAILSQLGECWRGMNTNVDEFEKLFRWASEMLTASDRLAMPQYPRAFWVSAATSAISSEHERAGLVISDLRALVSRCASAYKAFEQARHEVVGCAEAADEWLGQLPGDNWLADASDLLYEWITHAVSLPHWCKWQEVAASAEKAGLTPLISLLTSGSVAPSELSYAFDIGYTRWWVDQVVEREEPLRTFIAEQHTHEIERFSALDQKIADLAKRVIKHQLSTKVPPRARFGKDPEFGLLAREIEKKARHLPLRKLFGQMPQALATLAPCMMMSPLSVAQYLPADARQFDVVIFDEASQLPVWDAIGAIARGRQTIIVGDPKQLPPTAFFERAAGDYGEESDLEDLDSILDECIAANLPSKRLVWHYRSRYESLIAFSNAHYYKGRLVTFPSPVTEDRACHYVHVANGIYERGTGRVNREEARAVVRDVVRRLADVNFARANSSLGVVTMNSEQEHLIETMLDQERGADPRLDRFFGAEWHEPVFVKNLESVQGDERDVILLSVTYGPDESGRISHNFGPLNKDSGTRRLNVAVTRARSELAVFATLEPGQINPSRTKSEGARDLKLFLEYAQRGARALAEHAAPTDRDTESPFEDAVRSALESRGWAVHPQVGAAGFRIDLGVVHPVTPGRYLAGVECDGATYHRSATARDRDILRERVLVNLGWRIHRIWSSDWWMDADRALANLIRELEKDLASGALPNGAAPPTADSGALDVTTTPAEAETLECPDSRAPRPPKSAPIGNRVQAPRPARAVAAHTDRDVAGKCADHPYVIADLCAGGFSPDQGAFYETSYKPTLARMVSYVISIEGPIFDDVLVHRIASAHGFARAGGQIRSVVLNASGDRFPNREEAGRKIFWPLDADPDELPPFRTSSSGSRRPNDVPLAELATLAQRFLSQEEDRIPTAMARILGLERVRESTLTRFRSAIRLARAAPIRNPASPQR